MARKPPALYDVVRSRDGALINPNVPLKDARANRDRLNAEARIVNPATGKPTGMYLGEAVVYEVRSKDGLVVA